MGQKLAIPSMICIARGGENRISAIDRDVVRKGVLTQLGTPRFDGQDVFEGGGAGEG